LRAQAKTDADKMIAGKVNHGNQLGFRISRAGIDVVTEVDVVIEVDVVTEVDDKTKTFEGRALEETTIPELGPIQHGIS
jgi:hypothetical protein